MWRAARSRPTAGPGEETRFVTHANGAQAVAVREAVQRTIGCGAGSAFNN